MNALELMITRRSTRKFRPCQLESDKLAQILEAGRYAPSGGNCQTTHFLVIQNRQVLDKLTVMVRDAFSKMEETPDILAYLQQLGLKEGERVYGALAVGYPDTEDGLPSRIPLARTGNEVTYID